MPKVGARWTWSKKICDCNYCDRCKQRKRASDYYHRKKSVAARERVKPAIAQF